MQGKNAFSLIELILVILIIGVVTAITVPNLTGAIGRSRLRSATNIIVSSGRYARSMAVLKQQDMILTFDFGSAAISVRSSPPKHDTGEIVDFDEVKPEEPAVAGPIAAIEPDQNPTQNQAQAAASGNEELAKKLDNVIIVYVEIEGDEKGKYTEGICRVIYSSNGRCTPYSVGIIDQKGFTTKVEVDALSAVRTKE